jgi:RNA polymerase sigma-54 factor
MAMLPGLQFNVSQQLKLTPQLQQSIKILQHSAIELQEAISEALDSNIMLELEIEDATAPKESSELDSFDDFHEDIEFSALSEFNSVSDDLSIDHRNNLTENLDCQWDDLFDKDGNEAPVQQSEFEDFSVTSHHENDDYTPAESYTAAHEDLYTHLKWQVDTFTWGTDIQQAIAYYLIDLIDEQGYLSSDLGQVIEAISENEFFTPSEDDIETVLTLIQDNFDPAGIGARSIQECLLIQLKGILPQSELIVTAINMLTERFEWFAHGDFTRLKRVYGFNDTNWSRLMSLIQSLNPKPGLAFADSEREVIIPDLIIKRERKGWKVELNPSAYPRVKVNNEYVDLLKHLDKSSRSQEQADAMKEKLLEARGLIKSIQSRGETLLKVGAYLVAEQAKFLDEGDVAMKPLVLRDVADALGLHESTISRATTQKYMQTPRGTYELKYFFSSSVSQYGPQDQSAVAIKARIKQLIDAEDPKKPISDQDLVDKLETMKISVARRTVAKYREAMGIASSSQRKVRR